MSRRKVRADQGGDGKRRVLGIWNLKTAPLTLGGLLIFIEELNIVAQRESLKQMVDVAIVGELPLSMSRQAGEEGEPIVLLEQESYEDNPVLSLLFELEAVSDIYWLDDRAVEAFVLEKNYYVWPDLNHDAQYEYGTTLLAQNYYREKRTLPLLHCGSSARKRAWDFYRKLLAPSLPVVVHLKNHPHQEGQSNANLQAWAGFFKGVQANRDIKFVLIGNEDPGESIRNLENVVLTQDYGHDLARDLALIEMAYVFLGMASGPGNLAIFSEVPYVIFKNPGHHTAQMQKELGDRDHFNFARPFQKILRVQETDSGLIRGWESFVPYLHVEDWQKRIKQFHYQRG